MFKSLSLALVMGVTVLLTLGHGSALAQAAALDRIEAIQTLSENDNAQALQQLLGVGSALASDTPYTVRREYLSTLISLQSDAAEIKAAQTSVAELMRLAQANHDDTGVVIATTKAATLLELSGKPDEAVKSLELLETRALQTAHARALWGFYTVLGLGKLMLGQFEPALDSALKSSQYATAVTGKVKFLQLRSLILLTSIYMGMANWEKALQMAEEGLTIAKSVESNKLMATLYLSQGAIFSVLERAKDSVAAYEKALQTSRAAGLVRAQANALNNIGDSYLISKNYAKAEPFFRQAIDKYQEAGEVGGRATARANLGLALMGQGNVRGGAMEVQTALTSMQKSGAVTDQETLLGELSRMYEQAGFYREALATNRAQQELAKKLFRSDREQAVAKLQEQFNSVQREKQLELLARENSLKDAKINNQRLQQIIALLGIAVALIGGAFVYMLYWRVRQTNARLREANQQLEFHSVHDPLTGLFNRRSFLELMAKRSTDSANARREDDGPNGLMILDIDHFKNINDTLGHAGGDQVLVEIAKRLRSTVRDSDMVMRWGGEEFLIFSRRANPEHLTALAQRVLSAITSQPVSVGDQTVPMTISGGFVPLPFSGLPEVDFNWEMAIHIADQALYLAKDHGRNRIYGLSHLLAPWAQALPVLEHQLSAALDAGMADLIEVIGPTAPMFAAPEPMLAAV